MAGSTGGWAAWSYSEDPTVVCEAGGEEIVSDTYGPGCGYMSGHAIALAYCGPDQNAAVFASGHTCLVSNSTVKVTPRLTAKVKGRYLVVSVKAKGLSKAAGKRLVVVKAGKKSVKAKLTAAGKAKVKLSKLGQRTKATVHFKGTSSVAAATKVVRLR
jgi:hypothetical protein